MLSLQPKLYRSLLNFSVGGYVDNVIKCNVWQASGYLKAITLYVDIIFAASFLE